MTFLPYHSTPLFAALLSILPRQLSPTFRFLYPYVTSLANPPITAITQAAITNLPFFSALNRYVLSVSQLQHHYTALISFWASVSSQAIEGMLSAAQSGRAPIQSQKLEELLLFVLPVLSDGFAMKDVPALTEACCAVTIILAAKGSLSDEVIDGLMKTIAGRWQEQTIDVRLVSLALLAQRRASHKLPKFVIKRLLLIPKSVDQLVLVSHNYQVDRLVLGYTIGCVNRIGRHEGEEETRVISSIFEAEILSEKQIGRVISALLKRANDAEDLDVHARQSLAQLVLFVANTESFRDAWQEAVDKLGIDMTNLESVLGVDMPRRDVILDLMDTDDNEPVLQSLQSSESTPDNQLDDLSKWKSTARSFLDLNQTDDFMTLKDAFATAIESSLAPSIPSNHRFLSLPVLRKESALQDPTFISFFMRICYGFYSARLRAVALRIVRDILAPVFQVSETKHILIPLLLMGLHDDESSVRRNTASIIKLLVKPLEYEGSSQRIQWSVQELLPAIPRSHQVPKDKDFQNLLEKVLVPYLESFVLDHTVLGTILQAPTNADFIRKSSILMLVAQQLSAASVLSMRLRLSSILSMATRDIPDSIRKVILPSTLKWIQLSPEDSESLCNREQLHSQDVTNSLISVIGSREVQILQKVFQGHLAKDRKDVHVSAFAHLKRVWSTFAPEEQNDTAFVLLDVALADANDNSMTSRRNLALESLGSQKLSTDTLYRFLDALPKAVQMPIIAPAFKRRRTSRSEKSRMDVINMDELSQNLRRYTVTLELVSRSDPQKHTLLFKPLFQCFGEIQHYRVQADSGLTYIQTLAIDALLAIVNEAKESQKPPPDTSFIRTDLLVDCLRHNINPQVQNSALLLISSLATWAPEVVLHSVMPIFTFMGSSILRQSDDYSAHVIDQTVSRVLPPLAASLRKSSRMVLKGVADLLQSFVAAFEHMPLHRRLGLFEKVVRALGPSDCLFAALIMLADRYQHDDRVQRFQAELLDQFDAETQLLALDQYATLLLDTQKTRRDISELVLGLKDKSEDEVHEITSNLLSNFVQLLSDQRIRSGIATSFNLGIRILENQRKRFEKLLWSSVKILQSLYLQDTLADKAAKVLSHVFHLLPLAELLHSARSVLARSEIEVQSILLQSITEQCRQVNSADNDGKNSLLNFMDVTTDIIKTSKDRDLKKGAISCIDNISECFGKQDISKVLSAARTMAGSDALGCPNLDVQIMALLCLASMVEILQDDFIELMPQLFPLTFDYFDLSIRPESCDANLNNACFSLINSMIEYLPFIFTGSLLDRSLQLAQASAQSTIATTVRESRSQYYELLTKKIGPAEMFSALKRNLAIENLNVEYLDFAKAVVEYHTKSAIGRSSANIFDFLLQGFDCWRVAVTAETGDVDQRKLDDIQRAFMEIAVTVTMKLSDATFRPFFIRLVEWVDALGKNDRLGKILRATTLFQFFSTLSEKLKSLLTNYSAHILEAAADLLQSTDSSQDYALRLLLSLLSALEQSFQYDEDDFWQSPVHFETICHPLLLRLERDGKSTLTDSIITTITSLAAAVGSSDHHKMMNSTLLKFMRSNEKNTRLVAVKCELAITERLGEEWLHLLSEMLPTITELLEDDDAEVERTTRVWVKKVEEVLGESMDAMLQ